MSGSTKSIIMLPIVADEAITVLAGYFRGWKFS